MRKRGGISVFFTALNIFLIAVVLLAGIVFYAGYLFGSSQSRVVSAFGYSFHVADEMDEQDSVKNKTFIFSKLIKPSELQAGNLVTVEKTGGGRFSARYFGKSDSGSEYLFLKDGKAETAALSEIQIQSIGLHKYHSDIIGKIFSVFSENKNTLLASELALVLILAVSLIIVIARRESFKVPKPKTTRPAAEINLDELISVDHGVEFEKAKHREE